MADISHAIASDKNVKKALAGLHDVSAALSTQAAIAAGANERKAALTAKIERATREGDTKADIHGMHADLAQATADGEAAAREMGPLGGAVKLHEQRVVNAKRDAIRTLMADLRRRTRVVEDEAAGALDAFDAALDKIKALLDEHIQLKGAWHAVGGDKRDSGLDLLSLERTEIDRLRAPQGPLTLIRVLFSHLIARGGRTRPAA